MINLMKQGLFNRLCDKDGSLTLSGFFWLMAAVMGAFFTPFMLLL